MAGRFERALLTALVGGATWLCGSHLSAASPPPQIPPPEGGGVGPDTVRYILAPIEVTGTRERATAPPVATITVDPEQVRTTPSENPYDLIRRVAGLEVHDQGQGPGFSSNVVLRGFTADHSSDVLLTVDGVPVNLPVHGHIEGYADWSFLFPGAVSSLRVIHGPSSPLHGDFSIAGAVELYTQADADDVRGSVSANEVGDVSGWVTAGRRGPNGGGLVGLDLRRARGWREHSTRNIGNVLLRGWRSVGDGRLEGGGAIHRATWDSPGFLSVTDFESGDLRGSGEGSDGGEQARGVFHARYAAPVGQDRFLHVMAWGVVSTLDLFLTTPGHTDALGNLYQSGESDRRWGAGGEAEHSWIAPWGELTLGTSVRTDRAAYDKERTLRRREIEGEVAIDAEHTAAGIYARWRKTVWDRVGLDLGARVDHLRYRSFNRLGTALPSSGQSLGPNGPFPILLHIIGEQGPVGEWVAGDFTVASPKLGARFSVTSQLSLTASLSRGFRSAVGVLGDPDRPPFLAWAHELGLDYERPRLVGHLSLFRTDVSNERTQDPITLVISSSGSSVRQGVEADFAVELGRGVSLSGRATYTDAWLSGRYADAHHDHADDEAQVPVLDLGAAAGGLTMQMTPGQVTPGEADESGQRVPGVSEYVANLSVAAPLWWNTEGNVTWRVTGPYVPIGEPSVATDGFSLLDLGLTLPGFRGFLLDLEVRNALDHTYAEMRSSGYVSPGTPRSLSVTLHYLGGN